MSDYHFFALFNFDIIKEWLNLKPNLSESEIKRYYDRTSYNYHFITILIQLFKLMIVNKILNYFYKKYLKSNIEIIYKFQLKEIIEITSA